MSMVMQVFAVPAASLEGILADEERLEAMLEGESEDVIATADLDKAWHGVHFLLTGTAWEGEPGAALLVRGGRESEAEIGYGPARGFDAAEARAFRAELARLDEDEVRRRFDPERMKKLEIYPDVWDRAEEQEGLIEFLGDAVGQLQDLFAAAEKESAAIVITLT